MEVASIHVTASEKKLSARQTPPRRSKIYMANSSNCSRRMAQKERTVGRERLFSPKLKCHKKYNALDQRFETFESFDKRK